MWSPAHAVRTASMPPTASSPCRSTSLPRTGPGLLVRRAMDEHGGIDVLVNNVGAVRLRLEGFLGTSDDEFEWAMQMNFFTALRATRAAMVPMVERAPAGSSTSPR